ncbi:MAG: DUF5995 family protein [Chloroflexota bacterium]
METLAHPVLERMQALVLQWRRLADQRAVFLDCYRLMTANMLQAIDRREFNDPAWVDHLLRRFADYYFVALDAYQRDAAAAPRVWQAAFEAAQGGRLLPAQNLLLGVNAHINYDLVLTLEELLQPEWQQLDEARRQARFADHCRVNEIIAATIDAVQDQVLEPAMPALQVFDALLGRLDEHIISRLIAGWRGNVWQHALELVEAPGADERAALTRQVETEALQMAKWIGWQED